MCVDVYFAQIVGVDCRRMNKNDGESTSIVDNVNKKIISIRSIKDKVNKCEKNVDCRNKVAGNHFQYPDSDQTPRVVLV